MTRSVWLGKDTLLLELLDLGMPWYEIAKQMKLSTSACRRRAQKYGRHNKAMHGKSSVAYPRPEATARPLPEGATTLPPLPSLLLPLPVLQAD